MPPRPLASVKGQTWAPLGRCEDRVVRMLLSFQRPSRPIRKGTPSQRGALRRNLPPECGPGTVAPGGPTRKPPSQRPPRVYDVRGRLPDLDAPELSFADLQHLAIQ